MDNHQFIIPQGSTPRIEIRLPIELESGDKAVVTFAQKDKPVKEYGLNVTPTAAIAGTGTLSVDDDDPSLLILEMTQADTLSIPSGDAELHLRVKTSAGADTYMPKVGAIAPARYSEVIP